MLNFFKNGFMIKAVLSMTSIASFLVPSNFVAAQNYYDSSDCCEDGCCQTNRSTFWILGGAALLGAAAGAGTGYAAGRSRNHHHHGSEGCGCDNGCGCADFGCGNFGCGNECGVPTDSLTFSPSVFIPVATTLVATTVNVSVIPTTRCGILAPISLGSISIPAGVTNTQFTASPTSTTVTAPSGSTYTIVYDFTPPPPVAGRVKIEATVTGTTNVFSGSPCDCDLTNVTVTPADVQNSVTNTVTTSGTEQFQLTYTPNNS